MVDSVQKSDNERERANAVTELFRNHNRTLVRFLQSKLQNEQEAREIAQEAYVRLLELGRTGAVGFLRAYLFKIASNLAVDRLRTRNAHARIDRDRPDALDEITGNSVESEVVAADQMRMFWAALEELPQHYAKAFLMHRIDNLSTDQIGKSMGRSDRMIRRYLVYSLNYCRYRLHGLTRDAARDRMGTGWTNHD